MSTGAETVAVIDVGSNSIKLLVARHSEQGLEAVLSQTIETRISAGISQSHPFLLPEAMDAGVATIVELYDLAQSYAPAAMQIVATSAVRDAGNREQFIAKVRAATRLELRVLSGIEEAGYIGKGIACDPQVVGTEDFVQMDIGGGSLELIRFVCGKIEQAISLQLGAVRLTERFLRDKTPAIRPETKTEIRQHVAKVISASGFNLADQQLPMVVTGGAFVISRAILGFRAGEDLNSSAPKLTYAALSALESELSALSLAERSQVDLLPSARADIVPVALITILQVLEMAECESVLHSFYNLRYGIAAELLERF
jgi:exopolyphosphatase/guanosine-5'-triphosphate,3'-diphosphate pyrophosphatase